MTQQSEPPEPDGDADHPEHAARRPRGAVILVWLLWGLMTILAIAYVGRYGSNVPSWDEWDMVPTLTSHQPVTWQWLWSQHNEHRVPVPRLLLLGIAAVWGIDFRAAMFANVILASGLAAGAIAAARRVRGRITWTDAVIPLLLLNLGQGLNFIWGWQIEFFSSTALAGAALLLIVIGGRRSTAAFSLAMGAILTLLSGTGAHGVALVPALATWLLAVAFLRWLGARRPGSDPQPGARRDTLTPLVVGIACLGLAGAYFIGFEKVPYHPSSPGLRASALTSLKFLTMGFGPAVRQVWPASGLLFVILITGAGLVAVAALRDRTERIRGLGMLAFLSAMGCLALGIGLGRDGFEPRYITLSVPALLAAYFALVLYAPARLGAAGRWSMLAAAVLALWTNTRFGIEYARDAREHLAAFERDTGAGASPFRLIHDHGGWLHPHPDLLGDYLPMLRQAGVDPYVRINDNPPFQEMHIPLEPVAMQDLAWDPITATAHASGYAPQLTLSLDRPIRVAGIRMRYTHAKPSDGVPYVSIYWKNGEGDEFDTRRFSKYSATGDRANWLRGSFTRLGDSESSMTVWVLDQIDHIRIHPDFEPCSFTIHEVTLLLLPTGSD